MNALKNGLRGIRVLIVEDEPLVAMLIEDILSDIGCQTAGVVARLPEALSQNAGLHYDIVMLDVNLQGEYSFPFANRLAEKRIPFIFSTGYGEAGIPESLRHVPVLQKPFQEPELEQALTAALAVKT